MKLTVAQLAESVDGNVRGRVDLVVEALCAIDQGHATAICPLFDKRYLARMAEPPGAVLCGADLASVALESRVPSVLVHKNPQSALATLIDLFYPPEPLTGFVHPSAIVETSAEIHPDAWIGPGAVIGARVSIGRGSRVCPNAVITGESQIGCFVRIGPGAVIGAEGFGFVPGPDGPVKIRQVGRVVIEDHVEIGANTCVDRATLGETRIGFMSKLDNLVQVGHNARVGKRTLIAGQTGLAGSTVIGDDAMLGGQVGIADHLEIGQRAKVAAKSGVTRNVADGEVVGGYPALTRLRWLRAMALLNRLGDKSNITGSGTEDL
jgi:UDP-3-O-[3-hydroxymyristoyl] glucosamine N-acyltransferase